MTAQWSIGCPTQKPADALEWVAKQRSAYEAHEKLTDESAQELRTKALDLAEAVIKAQTGDAVLVGVTGYGSTSERADGSKCFTISVAIGSQSTAPPLTKPV